jgi:hypothetical protein
MSSTSKRLPLVCLLSLALAPGCANQDAPPPKTPAKVAVKTGSSPAKVASAALTIAKSYSGRVRLGMKAPGAKAEARGGQVLREQAAYEAFIGRIPTRRITKKQPAPPSDDPLLNKPKVNFATQMVIAFDRDDMYVGPRIERVVKRGDDAVVHVVLPDPGQSRIMARVMDIGTYHAVVVPKVSGKVSFKVSAKPAKSTAAKPGPREKTER